MCYNTDLVMLARGIFSPYEQDLGSTLCELIAIVQALYIYKDTVSNTCVSFFTDSMGVVFVLTNLFSKNVTIRDYIQETIDW